ncbi:ATP-binding protein [Micromonospora sp. NPDC049559]|uniref:ATP-binding protein n=1 Tax=Micromonospora sp. NPDC049559 TaxID=3155923 RepID=UPI003428BBC0
MSDEDPLAPHTVLPVEPVPLIAETFDRGQVTEVRHSVSGCAAAAGLRGQRLDDFVLAVNELITNAVRHGGGRGWLRLWHEAGTVYCEVSDAGVGFDSVEHESGQRPEPGTAGGWGLWLARQLSDEMRVLTGAAGTTVRVGTAIEQPAPERLATEAAGGLVGQPEPDGLAAG